MATSAYLNQAYLAYFGRPVDVNGATAFASATNEQVQAAFYASAESQALYGTTVDANFINNVYLNVLGRAAEPAGITYWLSQISKGLVTPAGAAIAILNGAQGSDVTTVNNKLTAAAAFTTGLDTTAEMIGYSGTAAAAAARAFLATITTTAATQAQIDAAIVSSTTGGATGTTFTLTNVADNLTGTSGDDLFRAVLDSQSNTADATGNGSETLQTTDSVSGNTGTDTLSITATGNTANAATPLFVSGVEKVQVKNLGTGVAAAGVTTLDLGSVTGLQEVINDGSTNAVAFQNIASSAVTVKNVTTAVGTTFTRGTAPVTTDLTVNFENLGKAAVVSDATGTAATQMAAFSSLSANNAPTKVTLNATGYVNVLSAELSGNAGAGHTIETLTINAAGKTIFGAALGGADVTGFDTTKAGTIVVTGAGDVALNTLAAVVQTVNASANTGGVTLAGTVYNTGTNAAALAAPGLKLTGGSGNDSFTFDGAATAVVDMGAGNDTAIVNTGLTAGASIKGGDGADTVQLAVADINALEAQTAAGTALRATISGFEKLGVTGDLTAAIHASRAGGYNYVVLNGAVDNADVGPVADQSVNITGLTTGATVEFRALGVNEDIAEVVMTDAALTTTDALNIVLNANLAAAANTNSQVTAKVGVAGINIVNVTANDRVNDVTDDDLTAAGDVADNGAGDGYTLALSNAANLNTVNVAGSSFVSYTLAAGTNAVTLVDASASTGNFTVDVSAFAGTQRLEIKGSQGINTITGDDETFGEKITGGAKSDSITGGAGADDMTGNGGRDYFIQGAAASGTTATTVDQITDFGKVTVAATVADVGGMTNIATFQGAATARGGDNADIIDFTAVTASAVATAQSAADDAAINVALEALDVSDATQWAGKVVNASIAKGILTVGGANAAEVDTLAEWVAVANVAAGTNGETAAFLFNGNTYVFQQQAAGDELVELTGTTGVTGVVLVGGAVAAAAGDIFIL